MHSHHLGHSLHAASNPKVLWSALPGSGEDPGDPWRVPSTADWAQWWKGSCVRTWWSWLPPGCKACTCLGTDFGCPCGIGRWRRSRWHRGSLPWQREGPGLRGRSACGERPRWGMSRGRNPRLAPVRLACRLLAPAVSSWHKNNRLSVYRSKTHKRLNEHFLIGGNRTKHAHFWGSPLFQATYNIKTNN